MWYNFIMNKFKLNFTSISLAELAVIFILGGVPLFFNYFFPTSLDLSKLFFFRVFLYIFALAIFCHLVLNSFKIKIQQPLILLPLFLLLAYLAFSLFFSNDLATSWFGSYQRQEGFLSWFFYILWSLLLVIYLSLYSKLEKFSKINLFLKVISISGALVSLYALCQLLGWDFWQWQEAAKITGRAFSTLGQPNYLACYLVLILPLSAYLGFTARKIKSKVLWLAIFSLEIIALIISGSRATFFSFLLVSGLFLFWFLKRRKKFTFSKGLVILGLGMVFLVSFVGLLAIKSPTRLSQLSDFKTGSTSVRLNLWQDGFKLFLNKPLFGYGLENQADAYLKYYKINDALYSSPNVSNDRAHNLILDILLSSGLFGLSFFVYFIYQIIKGLLRLSKESEFSTLAIFLIWSLTTYLVSLLFNFSVITTNVYFWFLIGLSLSLSEKNIFLINLRPFKNNLKSSILIVTAFLLFIWGLNLENKAFQAEYYYQKILVAVTSNEYFSALTLKEYLDDTKPNEVLRDYYNNNLSLRLLEKLPSINNKSDLSVVLNYLSINSDNLSDSRFENMFVKAFSFGALGRIYQADKLFTELAGISPELPKIYSAWGDVYLFNRDPKNAMLKFQLALAKIPDYQNTAISLQQKNRLINYNNYLRSRLNQASLLIK